MTTITPTDDALTIRRRLAAKAGEDYDTLDEFRKAHWTKEMLDYLLKGDTNDRASY